MATQTYKTVAGNTAPPLTLTATRDGAAITLVSASKVELIITQNSTVLNAGHQTCTITDAANGVVTYVRSTGDIPTTGTYTCDLKVTYADTTFEILYDQLKIKARKPAGS